MAKVHVSYFSLSLSLMNLVSHFILWDQKLCFYHLKRKRPSKMEEDQSLVLPSYSCLIFSVAWANLTASAIEVYSHCPSVYWHCFLQIDF